MNNNVMIIQRMFNAPLERVYRAFIDPHALAKWLAPRGFIAQIHQFDIREKGRYKIELTNFIYQQSYMLEGTFLEIIPKQKVRYLDESYGQYHPIEKTIEYHQNFMGTTVIVTQQGLMQDRPLETFFLDWQDSLYLLSLLVDV